MRILATAVLLGLAGTSAGQLIDTLDYGWSRTDAQTTYYEWDEFDTICGSIPDVGNMPMMVGDEIAFLCEEGGNGAFLTSSANIYSFSAPTSFTVDVPVDGVAGETTTVVLALQTLGNEVDVTTVLADGVSATTVEEIARGAAGGPFGGLDVTTAFVFEVPTQNPIRIEFEAAGSSMSLDRISVDTISEAAVCLADVNGDGLTTPADFTAWVLAFNTTGEGCDQNGDGMCTPQDFSAFILNFNSGC